MTLTRLVLLIASVVLLLLGRAESKLKQPVVFTTPFKITPDYTLRSHFLQPNLVYGSKDCGGSARTLQIIHQDCVTELAGICAVPVNKTGRIEAFFIPSENLDDVVVRGSVTLQNGENISFDVPVPETRLTAGQVYIFSTEGHATKEVLGKFITSKIEVMSKKDKRVHVCAAADFIVYSEE